MAVISPTGLELARRQRGLRQSELAKLAGVDRSAVSRCESGFVPGPTVRTRLAEALGVPEGELWCHNDRDRAGNAATETRGARDARPAA